MGLREPERASEGIYFFGRKGAGRGHVYTIAVSLISGKRYNGGVDKFGIPEDSIFGTSSPSRVRRAAFLQTPRTSYSWGTDAAPGLH